MISAFLFEGRLCVSTLDDQAGLMLIMDYPYGQSMSYFFFMSIISCHLVESIKKLVIWERRMSTLKWILTSYILCFGYLHPVPLFPKHGRVGLYASRPRSILL